MHALKGLVIGMAFLILAGFAFVAITIVERMDDSEPGVTSENPEIVQSGSIQFDPIEIDRATTLGQVVPAGDKLVLRFDRPDGSIILRILDLRSGGRGSTVRIQRGPGVN